MTLFEKHASLIHRANQALDERTFYTPYPEHHKAYGEELMTEGESAFQKQLNGNFNRLYAKQAEEWYGEEESPYSQESLGISYPVFDNKQLLTAAHEVKRAWKRVGPEERAGILVEVLDRLKARFFEMAHATMHTSGQSFMMAFQASGPHANDRALEAVALAYREQTRYPRNVSWEKPMGKSTIKLDKTFQAVPKGIALVVGCSTFPVWNTVPGLFANLATGNPVLVKPHPKAVLPIAMVVAELQEVFQENGLDPRIVQLAIDASDRLIASQLAENPAIKLIDYTGGTAFGEYLESLPGKITFTEKAGVNSVLIDSVEALQPVLDNLAFSLTLYSGQMCTAPQNFFIPKSGVREGDKTIPYQEVVERFKEAINNLVSHPKIGPGTLAAIQNDVTLENVKEADTLGGKMLIEPKMSENKDFPNARTCTPALIEADASQQDLFEDELFGPIGLVVKTDDSKHSLALIRQVAESHGAITCAAYTTDAAFEAEIREEMEEAFTPVSFNLTGFIWVNQAAAFSDFHVSGGNPAGNASFTDPAYVNRRFVWVGHRKLG